MAQAMMDPEKVRRFADDLQRFNSDLEGRLSLLQARSNLAQALTDFYTAAAGVRRALGIGATNTKAKP